MNFNTKMRRGAEFIYYGKGRLCLVMYFNAKIYHYLGPAYKGSISDDLKNQLEDAALHTSKAFAAVRRGRDDDPSERLSGLPGLDMLQGEKRDEDKSVVLEIAIMKPILRFLQLLCENHNRDLQVCCKEKFLSFLQS